MKWMLPLVLGFFAVGQAALNQKISDKLGLFATVVLNSLVLFSVGILALSTKYWAPQLLPSWLSVDQKSSSLQWWFMIPGIMGFFIVSGLPLSFSWLGAGKTMVLLIVSQILMSLIWDYINLKNMPSMNQLLGAGFAVIAALLTILGSQKS